MLSARKLVPVVQREGNGTKIRAAQCATAKGRVAFAFTCARGLFPPPPYDAACPAQIIGMAPPSAHTSPRAQTAADRVRADLLSVPRVFRRRLRDGLHTA